MKKIMILLAIASSALAVAGNKQANDSTVCFRVSMDCMACKVKIEKNIVYEKGVKGLDVNLADKIVKVRFNPAKNNSPALKTAIEKLKYDVEIVKDCK